MSEIKFELVRKIYPNGVVAVAGLNLSIASGELFCILGPSGCGKSSTLRMLAGLEQVTSGRVQISGVDVTGVPTERRDIAMVFENYALYPHLDVFGNIAMPLVARGLPRQQVAVRVRDVAKMLEIDRYLRTKVTALSGGQKQRVSIGRALVRSPKALLLDEPLGHLEAYMRSRLRTEIREMQSRLKLTTMLITHDQEEAAAMAARIAVMRGGEIEQIGTFGELLVRPSSRFVAEFIGTTPANFFPARLDTDGQSATVEGTGVSVALPRPGFGESSADRVEIAVRPEHIRLHSEDAPGMLPGIVSTIEPMGELCNVLMTSPAGPFSAIVASAKRPRLGEAVRASLVAEHVIVFDRHGRNLAHHG